MIETEKCKHFHSASLAIPRPSEAVTWLGNSTQTVTWNVAGTNTAPINTANANILLSTDDGLTFPTTLASNVPNDGSQSVTIPNISTTQARVRVETVGNIFFDISNTDFAILLNEPAMILFSRRFVFSGVPGRTRSASCSP